DDFKCSVVDPFIAAYRKGLTPNPCVLCNRTFKFKHLLALAKKLKCDRVATGHYAKIIRKNGCAALLEAADKKKDQSYFLARLTQKELSRTLLPLGTKTKRETYLLAKKFHIPLDFKNYKESQDLCFIPEKSPARFLRRYITDAKPGFFKTLQGERVGKHEGLAFYTIGQRKGLKIGGQDAPVHVVSVDQKNNTIFVAHARALQSTEICVCSLVFTRTLLRKNRTIRLSARIRSRSEKTRGTFTFRGSTGLFRFDHPVLAATPGQALVLYHEQEIVGSGLIVTESHGRKP
ncbi:MAG: tRNA 2-thiouridine(34) synthase MnmA, partial [Candidatus Peregrinibacteria bacterium]